MFQAGYVQAGVLMLFSYRYGTSLLVVSVGVCSVLYYYPRGEALQAVFSDLGCPFFLCDVHASPLWTVSGEVTEMANVQLFSGSAFVL